ncbi:unnamed protein product [Rotaria sp. Silwood2]|nr:unnamed protein product [Rotaria sp. Silwood2]CAF2674402.1 unnamed protein product [Rotaria sp. Silwood2]CAF2928485.1 unnamed protein product [Rotaria sp. Silwood2]CAF3060373.1 unnamed protein product [Rotaria sp. Silwood2]CAF4044936.1 unnamed protein product [Rotaria sp. Silwood2]
MNDDETSTHSPIRLLQKLAAYRASIASTSISSSSPSPQNERHSSILTESTNFFTRLWRPSPQQSTPSPTLIASHETQSASFDHIPEPCSTSIDVSSGLSSPSMLNRRMSFIRNVSLKNSSSNQISLQSSSMTIVPPIIPLFQAQPTTSSTVTNPSLEDTTSEQQFDTNSELLSQSLETNIYSSNPRLVNDQDDERNFQQQSLTYNERHRKLDSILKPMKLAVAQLSSLPMKIIEQQHHQDSVPSSEPSIDISTVSSNNL